MILDLEKQEIVNIQRASVWVRQTFPDWQRALKPSILFVGYPCQESLGFGQAYRRKLSLRRTRLGLLVSSNLSYRRLPLFLVPSVSPLCDCVYTLAFLGPDYILNA